ncbi:hypothetical protein GCM10009081_11040 [Brevundimonas nasdae]
MHASRCNSSDKSAREPARPFDIRQDPSGKSLTQLRNIKPPKVGSLEVGPKHNHVHSLISASLWRSAEKPIGLP